MLESQLRSGQITGKDFIRALLLSEKFRNDYCCFNSNCRMVDQIVGRVLGRSVHGDQERMTLSILIVQKGLPRLVDHFLESEEYQLGLWQRSAASPALPGARRPSPGHPTL